MEGQELGQGEPEETQGGAQVGDNEGPDQGRRGENRGDWAVVIGGKHGTSCPKA